VLILLILLLNDNLKGLSDVLTSRGVIVAAILNALGYISQFIGQQYTRATNASLLINLSAIFVAIFAHFYLKEKLSKMGSFGVLLAIIGAGLLITRGSISDLFTEHFLGDLFCLAAGVFWAMYIIESKKITGENFDDMHLLAAWFFYLTLISAPLAILQGIKRCGYEALFAILYTAIFCTILGFLLWYRGLKVLEATTSSIYFLLEVIVSAALEALIFGLTLSIMEIIGAIMAMTGVVVTDISFSRRFSGEIQ